MVARLREYCMAISKYLSRSVGEWTNTEMGHPVEETEVSIKTDREGKKFPGQGYENQDCSRQHGLG